MGELAEEPGRDHADRWECLRRQDAQARKQLLRAQRDQRAEEAGCPVADQ
jgi:hypothetical protein